MEVSPEMMKQLAETLGTPTGLQLAYVMLFGIAIVAGLFWVVWLIISMRLKPVDKIEEKLEKLQETLSDMSAKLWNESSLDAKIDSKILAALHEHEQLYHNIRK